MPSSKTYELPFAGLKITLPKAWEVYQEDQVISIFDSVNGAGALQLSMYYVERVDNLNLAQELNEFLEKKVDRPEITNFGNCSYSQFFDEENTYWRYWIFTKKNHLILASYNCSSEDSEKERKEVDRIIKSLVT